VDYDIIKIHLNKCRLLSIRKSWHCAGFSI